MPLEIAAATARRICQYGKSTGQSDVYVVLHGGEPMLAGQEWIRYFCHQMKRESGPTLKGHILLQTNGVLLDNEWVEFLAELKIRVGVSLDGPKEINDKFRLNHAGASSYSSVERGIRILSSHETSKDIFGGVLCVIDPAQDGLAIYQHFRSLNISDIDFLLPHEYNWDNCPPRSSASATPFADFLIPIFDHWWAEDNPSISIRMFTVIISLILGQTDLLDSLGGSPLREAIIESDGSIEPLDVLRACENGLTQIGLNVLRDPIDALLTDPLIQIGMRGPEGLSKACKACALHDVCGGGYLPHRYSSNNGFDNPSVYCPDLWKLITHILQRVIGSCGDQITVAEPDPLVAMVLEA